MDKLRKNFAGKENTSDDYNQKNTNNDKSSDDKNSNNAQNKESKK